MHTAHKDGSGIERAARVVLVGTWKDSFGGNPAEALQRIIMLRGFQLLPEGLRGHLSCGVEIGTGAYPDY
jgi:hypothetical protein